MFGNPLFGRALKLEHDYIQTYERYFLQRSIVLSDMSTTRNRDTRDTISQATSFQKDLSLTPFQAFNPATNYGSLVEVIGKMADTLNSHMEMLRDQKILNRMLRNTIDTLKDDIQNKSLRIKELEENVRQALKKDQQALKPLEIQLTQEATPSFNYQLEAYVKAKREKYEEHLMNRKTEEMHFLKKTQRKTDLAKIQKRNKRINRNKVNSVKVNNELATNEKFSLVSQIKKMDNKDQNKHAPANDDNKSAKNLQIKKRKRHPSLGKREQCLSQVTVC